MPHIHIKIVGKTDEEKAKLAAEITSAMMKSTSSPEADISIAIEDVEKEDWVEKVYKQDILAHQDLLYKKPGYDPLS